MNKLPACREDLAVGGQQQYKHQEKADVVAQIDDPHSCEYRDQQLAPRHAEDGIAKHCTNHRPAGFTKALDSTEIDLIHGVDDIERKVELYRVPRVE